MLVLVIEPQEYVNAMLVTKDRHASELVVLTTALATESAKVTKSLPLLQVHATNMRGTVATIWVACVILDFVEATVHCKNALRVMTRCTIKETIVAEIAVVEDYVTTTLDYVVASQDTLGINAIV